jgi:PIN domain nuclease of toxin-antitoxin system
VDVLLDTHILLWAILDPSQLSHQASTLIADPDNTIFVSAASAWEISTKVRIGKMPHAVDFEKRFRELVDRAGFVLLAIDTDTALNAGRFTAKHKDPFDRIIAAQALAMDIPVISVDPDLDNFGVRRIW